MRFFCFLLLSSFLREISCWKEIQIQTIYLQLGDNLGKFVQSRLIEHLSRTATVKTFVAEEQLPLHNHLDNHLILSLGNTSIFNSGFLEKCDFLTLPSVHCPLPSDLHQQARLILSKLSFLSPYIFNLSLSATTHHLFFTMLLLSSI
jgi:hypothetical protein